MNQHHALIVDDEPDIRELLQLTLGQMDIDCRTAADLQQAHKLLGQHQFDLCLTDMRLPDGTGLELVQHIQQHHPNLPVAVITAYGSMQTAVDALKYGAFDFVSKPVQLDTLRKLVNSALKLEHYPLHDRRSRDVLLGESLPMCQLRGMIYKLARSQAPVYICGESGTGKELVARQIHEKSARHDKPFIAVNCGAIPSELMESEFFGHKKGSFTGADRDKQGLFQAADGGTLFLDEVAELPIAMQVKLLRVIQERAVRAIGEQTESSMDVRILSATNKNLKALVEKNEFRNDLYFRLNVIELHLPALHERGNDITQLALHILKGLASNIRLDKSALEALQDYTFPGNIRELENILERAIALCEADTVYAEDLHLPEKPGTSTSISHETTGQRGNEPLEEYLATIERDEIETTLNACGWNRVEAAHMLGMSPRQLRYRMGKLGLSGEK